MWYQNQDYFFPSLHLANDILIWQIMVLQTKQTCWKGVQECHRRCERSSWLIDLSSNSSNAFFNPQNMICLIWSVPSQETNRFSFSFDFSFHYVLQQKSNTWSFSRAGLTDKDPVQGWITPVIFSGGCTPSEWESQKVHSLVLGLIGKLYHRHWLCPPQLKAVLEFMIFFHQAQ